MIGMDIETIPSENAIKSRQWVEYKEKKQITDDKDAALHPAFGQVVCICAFDSTAKRSFKRASLDEADLLTAFVEFCGGAMVLGGHAIKGFDIPFILNRCLSHGIQIPVGHPLQVVGKKPWEMLHVDTAEILKFGGWGNMSLDAACLMLGIPTPKTGPVNASSVWEAFKAGDLDGIVEYCAKDVRAFFAIVGTLEKCGVIPSGQ